MEFWVAATKTPTIQNAITLASQRGKTENSMSQESFRIHLTGNWPRSRVQINYQQTEYIFSDKFARLALAFWESELTKGNQYLFNGALCRLENFSQINGTLQLSLSRTCYRDLLFSNAHTGELLTEFGESGPVRALGISAVIETADGFLPLIRRSERVGEFPGGLDVVGGHVHPDDHLRDGVPDVFFAIADEVHAELGIPHHLLDAFICCGLAENWLHCKPELAFFLALPLTMKEVQELAASAREADEFAELFAVRAEQTSLQRFIAENAARITPSAHGCLQIYGRLKNWL